MTAVIHNADALATTPLRADALAIAEAGYQAVNTKGALQRFLQVTDGALRVGDRSYPIAGRRVYFVGIGKCAVAAGSAVEDILGETLTGGLALDVSKLHDAKVNKIQVLIGTHPLPSAENERASARILSFLAERDEHDLVIVLISGGGSVLLCSPEVPMTSADEGALFKALTGHGVPIHEMNTVRKHLSYARGGGLAKAAYPAEVVSLFISDVPGNDIAVIASGPTIRDSSTVEDARTILAHYGIEETRITFIETPKEEKYFERVSNVLFLSNLDALAAMNEAALRRGYAVEIVTDRLTGEAGTVGCTIAEKLRNAELRTALLYAGETTVALGNGDGRGGRNQELALSALLSLPEGGLVLSFASDGHDNTEHAGAIADATTLEHARVRNLSIEDSIRAHRSFDFFAATEDALITGYTGSNVSDLTLALT